MAKTFKTFQPKKFLNISQSYVTQLLKMELGGLPLMTSSPMTDPIEVYGGICRCRHPALCLCLFVCLFVFPVLEHNNGLLIVLFSVLRN